MNNNTRPRRKPSGAAGRRRAQAAQEAVSALVDAGLVSPVLGRELADVRPGSWGDIVTNAAARLERKRLALVRANLPAPAPRPPAPTEPPPARADWAEIDRRNAEPNAAAHLTDEQLLVLGRE